MQVQRYDYQNVSEGEWMHVDAAICEIAESC